MGLVVLVTTLVFDIPFRGSFWLLAISTGLYLLSTLGLGLLISTISKTQQQAMLSTFMFIMPAVMLSGFIFPISNMPPVIQWLTYLNPMRYFIEIIRSLFLKGVGIGILWHQMMALFIIGIISLSLASNRFRKTID